MEAHSPYEKSSDQQLDVLQSDASGGHSPEKMLTEAAVLRAEGVSWTAAEEAAVKVMHLDYLLVTAYFD